jgi:hypothetical protein
VHRLLFDKALSPLTPLAGLVSLAKARSVPTQRFDH